MPLTLRTPRPDRDVRAFLRWFNLMPAGFENRSVQTQRQVWRLTALAMGRRPDVDTVRNLTIDGPGGAIELRIFSAGEASHARPAFLWCHGGGFIIGGLDSAESICRTIARSTGCVTIAVRYRLAPEHALTACREDFLTALQWVARHGATLGIDATRLAIGGDSAGGNICAAVAQRVARDKGPKLCLQVLAYPATDLVEEFPSLAENASGYFLDERMLRVIQTRLGDIPDAQDPWLSPRREPDLKNVAPTLLVSAGFDPIRDDGLDYSARLRAAQVPVEVVHYPGQIHGFLNFDSVIDAASDALQRIAGSLDHAFRGERPADRTIEVADAAPNALARPFSPLTELVMTSLIGWATAERVWFTLLGRVSALTDHTVRKFLESPFVPGALVRHGALASAAALEARQTWPEAARPDAPHPTLPRRPGAHPARRHGTASHPPKKKLT